MEGTLAPAPAKQRRRTLLALPYDIIVSIVALVATTSPHPFPDLSNIGATCKAMYAAAKETEVLRRVALDKEKTVNWCNNSRFLVLLNNLASAGNLEACFLSGFLHIFMHGGVQSGLTLLEQAAATGHKTAAYVLGIVLYGTGDTPDAAKRYINQVEVDSDASTKCETNVTKNCIQCRWQVIPLIRWKKIAGAPNQVLQKLYHNRCASKGCGLTTVWLENNKVFCSKDCRIRHEYNMFRAYMILFPSTTG